MLHEFALEPKVLSTWDRFKYFMENFGFSEGRLISRFPKKWTSLVYAATKDCTDMERKKIEFVLQNIQNRIVASSRDYDPSIDWLANAISQHNKKPFHAIIVQESAQRHPFVLRGEDCDNLGNTVLLWHVERQSRVARNGKVLAEKLRPILTGASEILFVDKMFDPLNDRFVNPLIEFIRIISSSTRLIKRIEYHLLDNEVNTNEFRKDCESCLAPYVSEGTEVRFIRWQERRKGREFHARYVLTEHGGVLVDPGLDEYLQKPGHESQIHLLTNDRYQDVWDSFQTPDDPLDTTTAYDFVDSITINGTVKQMD